MTFLHRFVKKPHQRVPVAEQVQRLPISRVGLLPLVEKIHLLVPLTGYGTKIICLNQEPLALADPVTQLVRTFGLFASQLKLARGVVCEREARVRDRKIRIYADRVLVKRNRVSVIGPRVLLYA